MRHHHRRSPHARTLRVNSTEAERVLWRQLRQAELPVRFHRQVTLGPYIVDFVCYSANLILEADGGQHLNSQADRERDAWLEAQGFQVLRFWNHEILHHPEAVLTVIHDALTREVSR